MSKKPKPIGGIDSDPIAAERLLHALRPLEERETLDLPRPTPVEQLERCKLQPVPPRSTKKGTIPR